MSFAKWYASHIKVAVYWLLCPKMKYNKGGQRHVVDPKTIKDKRSGNSLEFISSFSASLQPAWNEQRGRGWRTKIYWSLDKHAWRNCRSPWTSILAGEKTGLMKDQWGYVGEDRLFVWLSGPLWNGFKLKNLIKAAHFSKIWLRLL